MARYDHVIVGGGMTADAAARAIRARRPNDTIAMFSREAHPPYGRPPLSKALWKGEPEESIWRKTEEAGVEMLLGRAVTSIDTASRTVGDDRGERHAYGALLLATGGIPRRLPGAPEEVIYFRTLDDYRRLRRAGGGRVAVIGGGFIGSEVAAALAMSGTPATMVFPESGIGARVYPGRLSEFLVSYFREKGVDVRPGEGVASVTKVDEGFRVALRSGSELSAAAVVAGIGIEPDVALARAAGIAVDNGIVVDERLETSAPGVFAAGDVANFFSRALGRRLRLEHEDAANTMGETAGANMAGEKKVYDHLPFFYSDLFDLGYEAAGELDSRLETVEDWKVEFREGVVYYLAGGRVRGVLLWNTWGQVDNARALIGEPGPFTAASLRGRLPA